MVLSAGLLGLLFLLDILVSLVSSSPQDILAVNPSVGDYVNLPTGVGLLKFSVFAISLVIGLAILIASLGWPLKRSSIRFKPSVVLGMLGAVFLVAAGAYVSFSGIVDGQVSYDQHQVDVNLLESGALVVLACIFFTIALSAVVGRKMLLTTLVVWLAAGLAFGFLDTKPLDGLYLFERTSRIEEPEVFTTLVETYRHTEDPAEEVDTPGRTIRIAATDDSQPRRVVIKADPVLDAKAPITGDDVEDTKDIEVDQDASAPEPLFRVRGATHTTYLRSSAGDVYEGGKWKQLDTNPVTIAPGVEVKDAVALAVASRGSGNREGGQSEEPNFWLAAYLSESGNNKVVDWIRVFPGVEGGMLKAGPAPVSQYPTRFQDRVTYNPFANTLSLPSPVSQYGWWSPLPAFSVSELVEAEAFADDTYLQLPDDLPERIYQLAEQLETTASPFLNANQIMTFLADEIVYASNDADIDVREPPVGMDPVDWLLFEERAGGTESITRAFVVLARAAGIPARVVSGWKIAAVPGFQDVHEDQSHQWAEIALKGVGWFTLDPATKLDLALNAEERSLSALLEELEKGIDPTARAEAAEALERAGDPDALPDLVEAMEHDPDPGVRISALIAIQSLGMDVLGEILLGDEDPVKRRAAAIALAKLNGSNSVDPLLRALSEDEDAEVRREAAKRLADIDGDRAAKELLQLATLNDDPSVREEALKALEELGAEVSRLENGAALVNLNGYASWIPGTTTRQAGRLPHIPVFSVTGAANTRYLRTSVGDVYLGNSWRQLDPVSIPYSAGDSVADVVRESYASRSDGFSSIPSHRVETESLFGLRESDDTSSYDLIHIEPEGMLTDLPAGLAPTSLHLLSVDNDGVLHPFSSTFSANESGKFHGWNSEVPYYTAAQYAAATPASDPTYTELPADLPARVRQLALAVTSGHTTTYAKAKALEQYLASNYSYNFANVSGSGGPPSGRDPMDWFLFDSREGTCGVFSSAFVVMARSIGIPARVVSGWAITPQEEPQVVYSDQAHQWAEVAFQELGWVGFEPTAGGAPFRASPWDALDNEEPARRAQALNALEERGVEVTRLENGAAIVLQGGAGPGGGQRGYFRWVAGTSTMQSQGLLHVPVFSVTGAANTSHLRTSVGDVYEGTHWRQMDPVSIPYRAGDSVVDVVRESYASRSGGFAPLPSHRVETESLFGFLESSEKSSHDQIHIEPAGMFTDLPAGLAPTSLHLQTVGHDGELHPFSATFSASDALESHSWTAEVPHYTTARYEAATVASDPTYTALPDGLPERIRDLALAVTSGHSTTHAKAKALERYLSTNYTYRFADASRSGDPPSGRDPMDWFLFDSGEGTCGVFSSAFVVMARSIGIPARVVSGWVITPMEGTQIVYGDQGHQWAEVPFEGLGWVGFEPTASGGPATRATASSVEDAVASGDPAEKERVLKSLEDAGAEVVRLENGAALVEQNENYVISGGTTTAQAQEPPHIPLFSVQGAANTPYLRTAVGDFYHGSHWSQIDHVSIPYISGHRVEDTVRDSYTNQADGFGDLPNHRVETESLFGLLEHTGNSHHDHIRIKPARMNTDMPAGLTPTSLHLRSADRGGELYPFSSTFYSNESGETFSWTSEIPIYSPSQYHNAVASSDPTYTQLPDGLPERIRDLALRVTAGHSSTFAKAKALEQFLSTTYTYAFADASRSGDPPPGRDPTDWFLFDHQEGTCGVFSSAFVVMARSIGIPARVVSGWAIAHTEDIQIVHADQAHQWAEVAFQGLGWVTFEPTAPGGPESRANEQYTAPTLEAVPLPPQDTITTITQWPEEVRRGTAFVVGGEVTTLDGQNVSGMLVEIYVNETKEHGGIEVGEAITSSAGYVASVELPTGVELGPYQLLARAVKNAKFNESWSDPDITVFSGSGLELTGPSEVTIDVEATFTGNLTDDAGDRVADSDLAVTIDGQAAPSVTTNSSGEFSFSSTFDSAGDHWVQVEVEGQEFILDNRARLNFQVTMPTETMIHAPAIVEVGQEFEIAGELRDVRGNPLAGESVHVQVGDAAERSVTTDSSGNFEFSDTVSESGEHILSAEFRRSGPLLASNGSALLASQHLVVLTIDGPGRIERRQGATFEGRLESETFAPTGDLELTLEDSSGQETTSINTDENGRFAHTQSSFINTGLHFLTGHYPGEEYVGSSTAGISFYVYAPTMLTLEGPEVVRDGQPFVLSGALVQDEGRPVPDAEIQLTGAESRTLVTDADGKFSWETSGSLDQTQTDEAVESELFFEVAFAGTDHLGPSTTNSSTLVGLPRIVVEAMEPIARGGTATLRGTVLLGNSPTPGVLVGISQEVSQESDEAGAFILDHPVPSNTPVGTWQVVVSAPDIEASFSVGIEIRSAPSMRFDPSDLPAPEYTTLLVATLLDDTGTGIAGATLRSDQGVETVTDDLGKAIIEVMTPETKDAVLVPVVVSFAGDARNLPIAESFALAIPAVSGFNWLLWVGIPGMVAIVAASVFAERRLRTVNVPDLVLRGRATVGPIPEPVASVPVSEDDEVDEGEKPLATLVEVIFSKADPVMDDVWGPGEDVSATFTLRDEDGEPISAAFVNVSVASLGTSSQLTTDDHGECSISWTGGEMGEYRVVVVYEGDDGYLSTSTSATFRIVEFREEIVRLYNLFLDWVTERTATLTEQSTPREIEVILVSEGVRLDQKSLDELISRFEEADYSEHPIARRHYDAMHRAWREVVRG